MFYFYEEMLIIVVAMLQYKYNNASLPKGQEKRRKRLKAVFALQKDPNPKPLLARYNAAREFDSGRNTVIVRGNRGPKYPYRACFVIFWGRKNIAGECSLKIPYSTIAVNVVFGLVY